MLSWDDFRIVKAIADCGSLAEAAKALRINQSTVFRKLAQIEHRLAARLFTRNRSGTTLTPRGEEMVRLAARMEQDVTAFEQGLHGKGPTEKPFATGVVPLDQVMARSGLEFLTDMVDGKLPQPPICATLGFHLAEVANGYARFDGLPEFRHYNPIGTVHGGFAATLLDSALGCAIFSTLAKGEAWTTLELKLNLVRPISKDTGTVQAEGRIIHRGRTVATAEGTVKDKAGKLYAHATTTCMIFPAKA
jgi:molybdate transport repressor ModE-like protein